MKWTSLLPLLSWCIASCPAETGNWIAVVAPGLQDAVRPLVDQRRADGWSVTVIDAKQDPVPAMQQIAALAAKGGPCCVLLAGDFAPGAGTNGVPPGKGGQLRMKGRPSDLPWSACAGKNAALEVGRLPARTAEEAAAMTAKILAWPREMAAQAAFPAARLIAGHHAAPEAFAKIADNLTNTLALRLIGKLGPEWRMDAMVHIDGSPWQVSGEDIGSEARRMMSSHGTILAYMGHSDPAAAYSKTTALLAGTGWKALPAAGPRPGLFFTCGCNSCELSPGVESFGFAAVRAPGGPPAVIGSHGITWAAMGYLAMAGLIDRIAAEPAGVRLGTLWLGVQEGLRNGGISGTEFAMLDLADGTQGQVPLEQQRLEHLESWMLLGDPAMPLMAALPDIQIKCGRPEAGKSLAVSGTVPAALAGAVLRVSLERHPATLPPDLPAVPDKGAGRLEATRERRRLSSAVTVATAEGPANGTTFSFSLPLPAALPSAPWTVRVETVKPPAAGAAIQLPAP